MTAHKLKTHCPQGHEYKDKNLYVYYSVQKKANQRACKECKANASKVRKQKQLKVKEEQTDSKRLESLRRQRIYQLRKLNGLQNSD